MRIACIELGISKVDAVLLTHAHMDHVAGFDDVRRFNTINGEKVPCDPNSPGANGRTFRIIGRPLNCYALPETIEIVHRIFPYISAKGGENGLFRPQIEFVEATGPFDLFGLRVTPLPVKHGFPCCGFLFEEPSTGGSIGYMSDCHEIPPDVLERLRGVDMMVLNCLREREHPTHLSFARAMDYLGQIAPKRAWLVHMCHDLTHAQWLERLAGTEIRPAYDGEEITP